jgi:dTDP-4-dehydrorhamnose reductase
MIWLLGADGMLGSELRDLLAARDLRHRASDREIDVTHEARVRALARSERPRWILNCAAYTAVDRAESEEARAFAVNARGAEHVAGAAQAVGARLVHVSTDYVFDGCREAPYGEEAPTGPLSAYGRSKAAGERRVRAACRSHFIVRTAWLHGPRGSNFVGTMLRLMRERPELRVVDDQRGSPTYARDLAEALLALVQQDAADFGTYHYTNEGACTWHAFAREIQAQALEAGLLARAVPIHPTPSADYPSPAPRPRNSVLATGRIRSALGLAIPTWQDGVARHLRRLAEPGTRP